MANPFYSQFGGGFPQPGNNPFGNFMNMLGQFNQFKANFRGDPKQQVQELLSSGRMSQQQFNQLSQLAQQFQNLMNNRQGV